MCIYIYVLCVLCLEDTILDNIRVFVIAGKPLSKDDLKENSELKREITQFSIKQSMGQMHLNADSKDAKGDEDEYDF